MYQGSFIFVLHSHVPYVRKSGKWPHGEEMLYEIMAETYIPLLNALTSLHNEKIPTSVSLGLTPILLEQLADKYMQEEFVGYIKTKIKAAYEDRTALPPLRPGVENTIEFYISWFSKILYDFEYTYNKDLIGAFKYLQDNDKLDILTSAATHGYLPLLSKDSAIRGQLKTGIRHYKKYFGRKPTGIWLPECGYRPITRDERVGLENFLDELGIQYFFTDSHVIEGSIAAKANPHPMPPKITMPIQMPNSATLLEHPFVSEFEPLKKVLVKEQDTNISTFHGYTVSESDVFVFGRDRLTGLQVWSADWGYPGDWNYREFHKKAPTSGIQYWKITDKKPGMQYKQPYVAEEAFGRAEQHATHFTHIVTEHLANYHTLSGKQGVLVSSYDTELFGHWWFEGVHWLECVIRNLTKGGKVRLISARDYVKEQKKVSSIHLPESSWGNGGQHSTWLNPDTEYMWPMIHQAEQHFEFLAQKFKKRPGKKKELLNQAARELLLLQSSDWPFLITTVQARDFAEKKFLDHLERFNKMCDMIEKDYNDPHAIEKISDTDNCFKDIDYKDFT